MPKPMIRLMSRLLHRPAARSLRARGALALLCLALAATLPIAPPIWAQDTPAAAPAKAPQFPAELTAPDTDPDLMRMRVLPLTADDLTALAAIWQDNVKTLSQQLVDLNIRLRSAEGDAAAPLRDRIAAVTSTRSRAFEDYSVVIDNLEAKGGDAAKIKAYRDYRTAILAGQAQQTDWQTLLQLGLSWATDPTGGLRLVFRTAIVVGAFLLLLIFARTVQRVVRRGLGRVPNISRLLLAFATAITYWLTIAVGLMIVLSALGVDITPLFAVFGGAAFIIAFAMQDTLGNLAAGVMIIVNRPFDEGDYVTLAGVGGTVKSVSIVSTTVTTPDNQVIVIPNNKVWGGIITNVTASTTRRVDLTFGIGYGDSIETAQGVLEKVVTGHPMVMKDPAPVIRVNALSDRSVDFIVRPWVRSADYWTVYWDLTRQVKEAFDAAGLSIPYPQTDMHLHLAKPVELSAPPAPPSPGAGGLGRPEGAPDFASGDEGEPA